MNILRKIIAFVVFYTVISFGFGIYHKLLLLIPYWKYIVPSVIVNLISVYAIFAIAMIVSSFVACYNQNCGRYMRSISSPIAILIIWYLILVVKSKIIGIMSWEIFVRTAIDIFIWMTALYYFTKIMLKAEARQ